MYIRFFFMTDIFKDKYKFSEIKCNVFLPFYRCVSDQHASQDVLRDQRERRG